jgi:hypothetical protein
LTPAFSLQLLVCFFSCHAVASSAFAQETRPNLRLSGFLPSGVRTSVTQRWGTLAFVAENLSDQDREARVLVSFSARPDLQYGRDLWVPARTNLSTWMQIGPAPAEGPDIGREIRVQFHDRTPGQEQVIVPRESERIQTQLVLWHKLEPSTTLMLDEAPAPELVFGKLPEPDSPDYDAQVLVRTFRAVRNLSEHVSRCPEGLLCPTPDGLDGADHFVLASERISGDPAGMRSLRQWVQRGGSLWVMLDRVRLESIAPLLGDALDFDVVDRTSLTHFAIETTEPAWQTGQRDGNAAPGALRLAAPEKPRQQEHERPVDFVRVVLPAGEQARHAINGWPVWFTRHVGRGRVIFTTLGPRGWHRKREGRDPRSPFDFYPNLPVALSPLETMADVLQPVQQETFRIDSLRQELADEIGYATVHRGTAAGVFVAFLIATVGLCVVLRRCGRPDLVGWVGPAAAVVAAVAFVALGEASRRAAKTTIAVAQLVEGDSATQDVSLRGKMAVYRPSSGPFPLAADEGGIVELDRHDVEGQTIRQLSADFDHWRLENLELPFGVRWSDFRYTLPTEQPIAAVAHFGPDGLEGKLAAGPLSGLGDALVDGPGDRHLAVRLRNDGSFHAGPKDLLPQGEFVAGGLLTDRQQRRQTIYRDYLARPLAGRREDRSFLLAWADPIDMHVRLAATEDSAGPRKAGSALVVLPLRLERSLPGSRVIVPGSFVKERRIWEGGTSGRTRESDAPTDMHLRFKLPSVVLPFKVERARLSVRLDAPSRRVTIAGWEGAEAGSGPTRELHRVESPLDPIQIDITAEPLLRLDGEGGLHLNINIGNLLAASSAAGAGGREKWTIHYIDLEITGRAE